MDPLIVQLDCIDRRIGELLSNPIPSITGYTDFNMVFEKYKDLRRKFPQSVWRNAAEKPGTSDAAMETTASLDELAKCQSLEDCLQKSWKREPDAQQRELMADIRAHHDRENRKKAMLKGLAHEAQDAVAEKQRKKAVLAEIAQAAREQHEFYRKKEQTLKKMAEEAARMREQMRLQEEKRQKAELEARRRYSELEAKARELEAKIAAERDFECVLAYYAAPDAQRTPQQVAQHTPPGGASSAQRSPRRDRHDALQLIELEAMRQTGSGVRDSRTQSDDYDFEHGAKKSARSQRSQVMDDAKQHFDEYRARSIISAVKRAYEELQKMGPRRQAFYMTRQEISQAISARQPSAHVSQKLREKEAIMQQSVDAHTKFQQDLERKVEYCERNGLEIAQQLNISNDQIRQLREEGTRLDERNRQLKEQIQVIAKELARRQREAQQKNQQRQPNSEPENAAKPGKVAH